MNFQTFLKKFNKDELIIDGCRHNSEMDGRIEVKLNIKKKLLKNYDNNVLKNANLSN